MSKLLLLGALSGLAFAQTSPVNVPKSDPDYQRAVQFERHKDQADATQARKESRHPSVAAPNASADRQIDNPNAVKDPGPARTKKDKNIQ